jgi:hypothetical protein
MVALEMFIEMNSTFPAVKITLMEMKITPLACFTERLWT